VGARSTDLGGGGGRGICALFRRKSSGVGTLGFSSDAAPILPVRSVLAVLVFLTLILPSESVFGSQYF
jgi:hypothetical protein